MEWGSILRGYGTGIGPATQFTNELCTQRHKARAAA